MRLLHTADWHVGRTMRGRSRVAEFEAVLAEVIEIARRERVEGMLVCGDIWDHHAPSAESDRLVFEALRECIGHGIQVVLLAGNHDNPRKLRALGLLSELLGVQTQWEVRRPNAGGVLAIEGREHIARIAAVPFITEGRYVDAAGIMGLQEDWVSAYADGVAEILRAASATFDAGTVNILATHIFVDNARIASVDGSERKLHIGQTYGVTAASLPSSPQYIALGHVHEPQDILDAPVPTAYSGSLLQLDFGERGQQKVVRIIDAEPGRPVTQTPIELTKGRPLAELRGTLGGSADAAITGLVIAGSGALAAISGLTLTRLGDRFNKLWLIALCAGVGAALALPTFFASGLVAFALFYMLSGFALGGVQPFVQAYLSTYSARAQQGLLFGLQSLVGGFGMGLGPLAASWISIQASTRHVFLSYSLAFAAIAVLMLAARLLGRRFTRYLPAAPRGEP